MMAQSGPQSAIRSSLQAPRCLLQETKISAWDRAPSYSEHGRYGNGKQRSVSAISKGEWGDSYSGIRTFFSQSPLHLVRNI
jgi:hypothetical protein